MTQEANDRRQLCEEATVTVSDLTLGKQERRRLCGQEASLKNEEATWFRCEFIGGDFVRRRLCEEATL